MPPANKILTGDRRKCGDRTGPFDASHAQKPEPKRGFTPETVAGQGCHIVLPPCPAGQGDIFFYYVSMCGDGANDCGALKAAHAGISLSTADASVASPFTSKTPTIECVPTVIREGRAALVTSFGVVKYMVAYSLTQFMSVIMLYTIGNNLTDPEFLYIDLGLITLLVLLFSRTASYPFLDPKPPRTKLISWKPLVSIIGQLSICIAFQAFIFIYIQKLPWYEAYEFNTEKDYRSYINTAVFCLSTYQYIWESIIFSRGKPYRQSIFSNWLFLASIIICFTFNTILLLSPGIEPLWNIIQLRMFPDFNFKLLILGLTILNFLLMFLFEEYFIENDHISFKRHQNDSNMMSSVDNDYTRNIRSDLHYVRIEHQIRQTPNWPPIITNAEDRTINSIVTRTHDITNNNHHDNNSIAIDDSFGSTNHLITTTVGNIQRSGSTPNNDLYSIHL
ncbi:unnamed protein product [Didymodactylos carnosus]|uniref:Cation-transporting P-type ATPase C-terminal domain-containing protein n=1 Tax=Didymodactylos carnosus TaxID=1234261 RepID=A0A813UZ52_9BILA|nr:unnamed protein product [Didymodactylos carnosus]CAF3617452.1 unnamed protein product [Didymodactylos carnosus]